MKQFFAFYNSGFDPELQAQTFADEATVHGTAVGKPIVSKIVDVTGNDPDKSFWNPPNTIECVTVDAGTKRESRLNPSALPDIDGMIDRL